MITGNAWYGLYTHHANYVKIIGLRLSAPSCFWGISAYGSDHITFQNCYVTNCRFSGIAASDGSTNITIDGCEVYATNSAFSEEMISLYGVDGFEIKNCVVHDPIGNQRIGINTKDGSKNGSIHHCTVYNTNANGIYVAATGKDIENIDVYDNLVYNSGLTSGYNDEAYALTDEAGIATMTNIRFFNNIAYNCGRFFALWQMGTEKYINCSFINNTGYSNCRTWGGQEIAIRSDAAHMSGCIIRNNIIYSTKSGAYGIMYDAYGDGGLVIDHNLFYNSDGVWHEDNKFGTNSVQANPLLTNPTTDFHILSNSPAKDTGSAIGAPSLDYIGISRPQGAAYDIGAYEYEINSTSKPPSTSLPDLNLHVLAIQGTFVKYTTLFTNPFVMICLQPLMIVKCGLLIYYSDKE